MNIAHFDVDSNIRSFLHDDIFNYSVQENKKSLLYDCISIKSASIINAKTLKNFPQLKLIVTRTVGTNHIDTNACRDKGISLYHIIDYGSYNIAEHALALLLAGMHNIVFCQEELHHGIFSYKNWLGISFKGKVVGVLGTGRIGLEFIKRIRVFADTIIAYDVYQNEKAAKDLNFSYVKFEEFIERTDIMSIHAPQTEETTHIINGNVMKKMKKGSIIINTSRGGLIDTAELVKQAEKFSFLGLDVLEDEESFSISHPLLTCKNVILTPHVAFFTDDSVKNIANETYVCIQNYLNNDNTGKVLLV